jgi:thiol-disulfide isomerase/thioredoxin
MNSKISHDVSVTCMAAVIAIGCSAQPPPRVPAASTPPAPVSEGRPTAAGNGLASEQRSDGSAPSIAIVPQVSAVIADASRSDKPILLYFGADWCPPCVVFERRVLSQQHVVDALAAYRYQKYDPETGPGMDAVRLFDVRAFPTLIFLSPKGLEVDRPQVPMNDEQFVRTLREMQPVAKAGPLDESQIDTVHDGRHLIASARAAENASKLGLASRFYRAALNAAAKDEDLAADAEMGRLRVETQVVDKKKHAELLFAFVRKYPASPRAIDALAGLAGFVNDIKIDANSLLRHAAKARVAMVEQKDVASLRRLAFIFQKLGDATGAAETEQSVKSLEASGAIAPGFQPPPELFGLRDPLTPARPSLLPTKDLPPEMRLKMDAMHFDMQLGRQLREQCNERPRRDDQVSVRLYTKGAKVERAVVLDPEAPTELHKCLENAALRLQGFPPDFGERHDIRVVFKIDPM